MHLMELSCEFGEFSRWNEFAEETRKFFNNRTSEMYRNLHGSCLRKIADLAICDNNYDVALSAYKEGFLLIVESEFLWRYTIGKQIRDTENLIRKYTPEVLSKLGRDLAEYWRSRQVLIEKSPESLLTFQQWEWEEILQLLYCSYIKPESQSPGAACQHSDSRIEKYFGSTLSVSQTPFSDT